MSEFEAVVVGAGFAGLSTAYHLAKAGLKKVVILEQAKTLGKHASGRNAGMIRQAISDPYVAKLAHEGALAIHKLPQQGWKGLKLRRTGSLLLSNEKDKGELDKIAKTLQREGLRFERLRKNEAEKKAFVLEGALFSEGLFCPSDCMIDIDALLNGFLKRLRAMGVKIFFNYELDRVEKTKEGFLVHAGEKTFSAKRLVNAGGAWASVIGQKSGAASVPLLGYRRHLFLSKPVKFKADHWPFTWDLSSELYFRPQAGALLLSPCDKKPFDLRNSKKHLQAWAVDSKMEKILWEKLKRFSKHFSFLKIKQAIAGLRTMTADGRFVIGEDPKVKNFFWVASLGGHGVTCSFSVGRLAADLIMGRNEDSLIEQAVSPKRFYNLDNRAWKKPGIKIWVPGVSLSKVILEERNE